jgi:hypothetical protein
MVKYRMNTLKLKGNLMGSPLTPLHSPNVSGLLAYSSVLDMSAAEMIGSGYFHEWRSTISGRGKKLNNCDEEEYE